MGFNRLERRVDRAIAVNDRYARAYANRGLVFVHRDKDYARGIADYKIPDRCIAIDALPRTPVGKIDKPTLRRLLAAPTSPTEIALP